MRLTEVLQQLPPMRTLLEQMRDEQIAVYAKLPPVAEDQPDPPALAIKRATTNAVKYALIDAVNLLAQVQKRLDIVTAGGQTRIAKPRQWDPRQVDLPVTYVSPNATPGLGQAPRLVAPDPKQKRRRKPRSTHVDKARE